MRTRTTSRRASRPRIEINDKTAVRAGFGLFYGPGQFEDRIQPIENYIERRRVGVADVPNNGLQYPVSASVLASTLSVRGYTHERPDEYNVQYGASVSRELPGRDQPVGRLHGKPGQGHVPARRGEHARLPMTRAGRTRASGRWTTRRPAASTAS